MDPERVAHARATLRRSNDDASSKRPASAEDRQSTLEQSSGIGAQRRSRVDLHDQLDGGGHGYDLFLR